ncbi:MAG: hypothetical protein ABSG57_12110 [Candidatus Bathyarchaeia archaeon]
MGRGRGRLFPEYEFKFTGHRPASVSIAGRRYVVKSWRDILLNSCEFVYAMNPSAFPKILELRGTKRVWFSRRANQLWEPIKIQGTDIFVDVNLNANGLVNRSLRVLRLFGLKPKIDIFLKK